MALVAIPPTLAQIMPVLGIAGLSLWVANSKAHKTSKDTEPQPSVEQLRDEELMETMGEWGAHATPYNVLHDQLETFGMAVREDIFMKSPDQEWRTNPNIDPVKEMVFPAFVALNALDRQRAYYIMSTMDGEIRPKKRVPISASLSREIHRPGQPEARSDIQGWKVMPDYANEQQVKDAVRQLRNPALRKDQALMPYDDSLFFSRATGQSFRYE